MPKMPGRSGFTLVELLIVISIIGILASIGLATFSSSQAKSRDTKRKADLEQIASALELYYNDKGQYPATSGGKIMGCGVSATSLCDWGVTFSNTTTKTIYMARIPSDPSGSFHYYYQSTIASGVYTKYQLYAHLENSQDKNILGSATGLDCGTGTDSCNYGVSSANTTP